MSREDIQKLLGGYATGTLTPAERDALFAAALEDQELFDAMAREESLRELLQDPVAKSRLTAALRTTRVPWHRRWLRPALLAAGTAAIAIVAVVALRSPRQQVVTIAQVARPQPPAPTPVAQPTAPSVAEPAPKPEPPPALKKVAPAPAENAAPAPTRQSPNDQTAAVDALAAGPAPPPPAPAAPPPPPATPRLAAPGAPVIALREPLAQAFAARNSAPVQDARALFYGAPLQISLQTNFIRAEAEAKARVVAQDANAPAVSPTPHLGLRYALLRVPPAGPEELNPSQELDSVQNLQLSLQANDGGYLYVFERAAGGQWVLRASEPIARMAPYLLPRTGSLGFPPAGNLELFVLFSRAPINPEDRQLTPRDDQVITVTPADRAAYVVSTSGNLPTQRLAFPLTLRRR